MTSSWITLLLFISPTTATAENESFGRRQAEARGLCSDVVLSLALGVHAHAGVGQFPRVEVRRCPPVGGLQLAAWETGVKAPSLVRDIERFSLGQVLVSGNIVVIEAPGPYDVILVLRYTRGQPHIEFSDSTHDEIRIGSKGSVVILTLTNSQTHKKNVRTFTVNEDDLTLQR